MYEYSKLRPLDDKDLDPSLWEKPRTTHRNLQPPKSERLVSLWIDGKLLFGRVYDGSDVEDKKNGHEYWNDEETFGIWMLHGNDREQFDFHDAENVTTEDGVPVHGLKHRLDSFAIEMEAFCDTQRKCNCFLKVNVKNTGATKETRKFGFMLRTAKEPLLIISPDQYHSYAPHRHMQRWKEQAPNTWRAEGDRFTDGTHIMTVSGEKLPVLNTADGVLDWELTLEAGEAKALIFVINKGEPSTGDYNAEKEITEKFWRKELARLNKLPASWQNDPETLRMVRHMVAQILQHITYNEGKDYLFIRQGGLRCIGFPGDTMWVYDVLPRIGDFADYIEPLFDTYFNVMQQESGEIVNIGIYWAMITSTILSSFGNYCKHSGEAGERFYHKYKDKAYAGFLWIKNTRAETENSDTLVRGLFPPLRACDYEQVYQNWQITDCYNVMNMKPYLEAARLFGDSRADEVQQEMDAYVGAIKLHLQPYLDEQKDSDELYIPLRPDGNDKELVRDDYPMYHYPKFILIGALDVSYSDKIYRWLINSNRSNGVFYGRTPVLKEGGVWYISAAEISWFQLWMQIGDYEKAREILRTQRQYTVTEEYCMMERIVIGQPYYVPWSPNVSAMCRLMWMMLAIEELDAK
ncbi:MAG: hypothetical protein IKJ94_01620 [Oscillospiraceae bacterium]|nr:hypothetical protein [Oscillospiraceae bacterium]